MLTKNSTKRGQISENKSSQNSLLKIAYFFAIPYFVN